MSFQSLTGDVALVSPSGVLRLAVLAPLASALAAASFRPRLQQSAREARAVAVSGPLFAGAVIVMHASSLAGRQFVDGPLRLGRVGSFELSLSLLLDGRAALLTLGACALAVAELVRTTDLDRLLDRTPRVGIALMGVLLAVLGDGPLPFAIGATIAALAASSLGPVASISSGVARPLGASLAHASGVLAMVGGFVLAWGLGGSFGIRVGHEPDYTRRNPVPAEIYTASELGYDAEASAVGPELWPVLVGLPVSAATGTPGPKALASGGMPTLASPGWVSFVSAPGSRLFLKGTEAAGTSPIVRREIPSGFVDMEIEPRGGGRRVRFRAVQVPPGREIAIVAVGPTLSFRELSAQLALDDGTGRFVRRTLDPEAPEHRRALGVPVVDLGVLAFALAALAIALLGSGTLGVGLHAILGVGLLARVGGFGLPTRLASAVALVFVLSGLALLARVLVAIRRRDEVAIPAELSRVLAALAAAGALAVPNAASLLLVGGLLALAGLEGLTKGAGHTLEARLLPVVTGVLAVVVLVLGRPLLVGAVGKLSGLGLVLGLSGLVLAVRSVSPAKRKKKASPFGARMAAALAALAALTGLLVGDPVRIAPAEVLLRTFQGAGTDLAVTGLFALALVVSWVVGARLPEPAPEAQA
ncbi:MAG: hypothetical protein IPJ34_29165 [Myxococcales bacterium]|nr:hypothetical protein [Myxococcales bacterium]